MRGPVRYILAVAVVTALAIHLTWRVSGEGLEVSATFLVLLLLGAVSAFFKMDAVGTDIDVSFTAVVLIAAIPLVGPFGAALLALIVPFADYRPNGPPLIAIVFNALMYSLQTACAALAYLALGGHNPDPARAVPLDYLFGVGLPLLGADAVLCLVNAAVLAGMMLATGVDPASTLWGPGLRTLPLYLGYGLTAFVFAVLWGPAGLGALSAVLIIAPLIVARWAFRQYVEQRHAHAHIIDTLAAAGLSRDRAIGRASRVAELARLLQVELQLGQRDIVSLTNGTALHDIGMLAVPRSVLRQPPARLTADQLRLLASHSEVGYQVVRDITFLADTALVVRHHHERFDGTGYPCGLRGADIPLAARVLAVADAYEAAAWSAPERPRHAWALRAMRAGAGTAYDPAVVDALERVLGDGPPPGSLLAQPAGPDIRGLAPSMRPATGWVDDIVREAVGAGRPTAERAPIAPEPVAHRRRYRHMPTVILSAIALLLPFLLAAGHIDAGTSSGRTPAAAPWAVIAVYVVTLVAAERFRVRRRGRPEAAPMALAAGLAMALTTGMPGAPHFHIPSWTVAGAVALAMTIDWVTTRWRVGVGERANLAFDSLLRLAVVTIVAIAMRDIPWSRGMSLEDLMTQWPPAQRALVMSALVLAVLVGKVPVRAWWRGRQEGTRATLLLPEQLRQSLGLVAAMAATGVLVAAAQPVLGMFALPLVLLPLVITQLSVRWHEDVRYAHLQAIRALSRLPETAGLVPAGHAHQVARLAVAVARDLGMGERDVEDLEHAALLHDVGQVSLRRPIPSGATVTAAPNDQERIARLGADIIAQTGDLGAVAEILRGQAVPYHRVVKGQIRLPLSSRIIKVANAYDDFVRSGAGSAAARQAYAFERLFLGLGHEYDPTVVSALERLLGEHGDDAEHDTPAPTPLRGAAAHVGPATHVGPGGSRGQSGQNGIAGTA